MRCYLLFVLRVWCLLFVICVKYVRTMLVMGTPYTSQSKACVWCCYHGGHATTLNCHVNVFVHRHSRPSFDMTCVASHRMSLRQSALRAPQPITHGLKEPPTFSAQAKSSLTRIFALLEAQAKAAWPHIDRAQSSPFQANPFARARISRGNNLLSTLLARTHWTSSSALRVEKKRSRSHRIHSAIS